LGEACEKNGVQLLLWFEPERVRGGEELEREHPEWLLYQRDESGNVVGDCLLDLGNDEARGWLIGHVNGLIKESHIAVYRQDFNFNPAPIWAQNEAEDRIGMLENRHALGYLAYWDALILANPGLWIDSCASGGRRNDLETMRRAVPLHYTDVGYGHHPIKQKQHREMFEWIPYFRAHNMNWDNAETGAYENGGRPTDTFAFHCALAPALTSMFTYNDTEENFEIGRRMDDIWREAAEIELSGDYYPMTECRLDPRDFYAMQFDDPIAHRGFIQVIRNTQVESDTYVVKAPCVHENAVYTLIDRETGKHLSLTSNELREGFAAMLAPRSGVIYFYTY
jgi:alpha-galactosidase